MKVLLNYFACYEEFDFRKRSLPYLLYHYIFMTQGYSHVTHDGVSSDFTSRDIYVKEDQVRCLILIRLGVSKEADSPAPHVVPVVNY